MKMKHSRPRATTTWAKSRSKAAPRQAAHAKQPDQLLERLTRIRVAQVGSLALLPGYDQAAKAALDYFLVGSITTHLREHLGTSSREA